MAWVAMYGRQVAFPENQVVEPVISSVALDRWHVGLLERRYVSVQDLLRPKVGRLGQVVITQGYVGEASA